MKTCNTCNNVLNESMFYKHFWNKDKLSGSCKRCDKRKVEDRRRTLTGFLTHTYSNQVRSSKYRGYDPPEYTKDEFIDWAMNNNEYIKMFNNWVESGYKKEYTPSFDRHSEINDMYDFKPYSLSRLRVITWGDHMKKPVLKKQKTVKVIAKNGDLIIRFDSINKASDFFRVSRKKIKYRMYSKKKINRFVIKREK